MQRNIWGFIVSGKGRILDLYCSRHQVALSYNVSAFQASEVQFCAKKSFILLTLVLKIAVLKVKNIPLWDIIIVWDEKYSSNVTKTAVFSTTAFHYQLFACSNLFTRKHENIHMQLLNN